MFVPQVFDKLLILSLLFGGFCFADNEYCQ